MPRYALLGWFALAAACSSDETTTLGQVTQEMAVCADGPTTYGIDVSRYQGDIDWDQVAGAGVEYAFIQISRSLTDLDVKFDYNWQRAKEVGILRGAYQRFQPAQDVIGQAEVFLQRLDPYEIGDLPPVLDVEDANDLSAAQIAAAVREWIDHVEPRLGVKPIIYTGFYFWRDQVGGADFSEYPLWIANYSATCPLVPPAWTRWTLHQYSSTAVIPGITANTVDVNRFNGTLAELTAMAKRATCGDGTCEGDETHDTCAADCPPCRGDTAAGAIVDKHCVASDDREPDPVESPPEPEGGCSTGRDHGAPLAGVLVGLALVASRRRRFVERRGALALPRRGR